jgi:hypothetical protein
MVTARRMLGLAVTDRSIAAVEVGVARGRRKVLHAAEFPLPEQAALPDPVLLGKALRQFLRQHHLSARRCVIGLGARWLMAKEKALPTGSADLMAGILSIAAEREFASDPKDLAFDYQGPYASAQGQSVLLVAAPRRRVDHLLAMARAAGLSVAAVTSSTIALAAATGGPPSLQRIVLHLSPGGAELAMQSGRSFSLVRRLAVAPPGADRARPASADPWFDDLSSELRRVVTLLPRGQATQGAPDLVVWDGIGLNDDAMGVLSERLSLEARLCEKASDLGIAEGLPAPVGGDYAAAAALALAGLGGERPAVDFLHSRLSPRRKIALGRKVAWAAGLGAAVLLAAVALALDWRWEQQEVQALKDQLGGLKESVASAKDLVDKTVFARGWYDRRPKCLDALRELVLAFPQEGRIWTTSVAFREGMQILVSGKATDEGAVLEVLDRLKGNPKFADVKPLYLREVGGGAPGVSFSISLRFAGAG